MSNKGYATAPYIHGQSHRIYSCNVLQLTIQPIVVQCNTCQASFSKLFKRYMTLHLLAVNLILQVQQQSNSLTALAYKACIRHMADKYYI